MKIISFSKYMLLILAVLALSGCATAISKNLQVQSEKDIFLEDIRKNPDNYQGKVVIWGGDIIRVINFKEQTHIEILEKPLDFLLKPKDTDQSGGRLVAVVDGYVDSAVYTKGKQITVAGEIIGQKTGLVGEFEYVYPLIHAKEIHLWPEKQRDACLYPYPYYYYPAHFHWWYHPCWRY